MSKMAYQKKISNLFVPSFSGKNLSLEIFSKNFMNFSVFF
jgi:hypothetical protein